MELKDDLVKGIFDNVRNLVLSSVIIATGAIIVRNNPNESPDVYLYVIGAYTILLGFGLFSLNVTHAFTKFSKLPLAKYAIFSLTTTYALIAMEFVRALWVGRVNFGL